MQHEHCLNQCYITQVTTFHSQPIIPVVLNACFLNLVPTGLGESRGEVPVLQPF